jgi:hypothetical protein
VAVPAPAEVSSGVQSPSSQPTRQLQDDARSAAGAANETALRSAGRRDALAEREASPKPVEPEQIVSPDPRVRWRFSATTPLEQSTDGGRTWEPVSIPATAALTAGVAPSAEECWLVGRGGAVLVTVDGRTWRLVAIPVAVDLVAVQASGGRTATVTAADGRRFQTADGGVSWTVRK